MRLYYSNINLIKTNLAIVLLLLLLLAVKFSNSSSSTDTSNESSDDDDAAAATAAAAAAANVSDNKFLSIYFSKISSNDFPIEIISELNELITKALNLENSNLVFGLPSNATDDDVNTGSCYLPFMIIGDLIVRSSNESPQTYAQYSIIWKNTLRNNLHLRKPFKTTTTGSDSSNNNNQGSGETTSFQQFFIVTDRHEAVVQSAGAEQMKRREELMIKKQEEERMLNGCNNSTRRNDLIKAMKSRSELLQLRLKKVDIADYAKSYDKLTSLVRGCQITASSILGVPEESIFFVNIRPGSVIAQFSVHPASDSELQKFNGLWGESLKSKNHIFTHHFEDIDFDFPPVGTLNYHASEDTTTAKSNSSNPGVITGVVLGSLILAIVVGGGSASYMYNKKDSETNKESSNASAVSVMKGGKQEDFVDDLANSPGLRDIVVRGSTTPNIHNYRN